MGKFKNFIAAAGASFLLLAASAASPAFAKPPNAANTDSGTGCLVADANGAYSFDAACDYHIVTRNNRGGARALISYHDHGHLPAAAPHPTSARHNNVSFTFADGSVCTGTEMTTPSGDYSSDCHFNASH